MTMVRTSRPGTAYRWSWCRRRLPSTRYPRAGSVARYSPTKAMDRELHRLCPQPQARTPTGHLANAAEHALGQAVFLQGSSTGGSISLQFAVDRPESRAPAGGALGRVPAGAAAPDATAEMARLIRAGKPREAWASVMAVTLPAPLRRPARRFARIARTMVPTHTGPLTRSSPSRPDPISRASTNPGRFSVQTRSQPGVAVDEARPPAPHKFRMAVASVGVPFRRAGGPSSRGRPGSADM